jgi:hypothetical protein
VPLCFHYGFLNLRTVSGDGAASLDSLLWNDMLAVCLQLLSLCLIIVCTMVVMNLVIDF